jgi:hypothetical protein
MTITINEVKSKTMKRKHFAIVLSFLIVLSVSACSGGRNKAINIGDENFRTGTEGLRLDFLPYSPPDKLFDDEDLKVRIEIKNRGAEDVLGSNNKVYLSGFDTSIITGIPTTGIEIPDMEGKKFYNPDGDFDTIDFTGFVRDLQSRNIDVYNPVIMATACYKYATIADPKVCVDPDPFSTAITDKVCDFQSQPGLGSQGGPISIEDVEVEAMPGKTRFKIAVQNVGGGNVLKDGVDVLDRCNPYDATGLDVNDIDHVYIEDVSLGDVSIAATCKPLDNGYLRLRTSGAGFMICEADGLVGPAYTTPLRIKVSYNYRSTISKTIKIIQTP